MPGGGALVRELTRLWVLREAGALSGEQFSVAKQALLCSGRGPELGIAQARGVTKGAYAGYAPGFLLPEPGAADRAEQEWRDRGCRGPLAAATTPLLVAEFAGADEFAAAAGLLCRLLTNIEQHPAEAKYRVVQRNNRRIAGELLSVPGMEEAMVEMGWVSEGGEQDSAKGSLRYCGRTDILPGTRRAVEQAIEWAQEGKEKRQKALRDAKHKERMAAKHPEEYARFQERMKEDRERAAGRKAAASEAKKLQFGGNVTKFEPPVQRG